MKKRINLSIFKAFFNSKKLGSVLLLVCVVASLIIANSGYAVSFADFLAKTIGFKISAFHLDYSIATWINDGLMAIFFLLVGLEIKRELIEGELSSLKKASLPVLAAIGGMLVPALIYALFNKNTVTANGWGIPMATDIAFALAIVALLEKNVPSSLKIFLAALAIVDDLGAILVIAFFYTEQIHWNQLFIAAGIFALLLVFNFFKLKNLLLYLIPGVFLWYFVHHSGIHATIAGVLLAFTIPTNDTAELSPLEKLEHALTQPVALVIMPVFALANTNITFVNGMVEGLASPLGLGIILGLFLGKTIGITLMSFIAVKLKLAKLPTGANWKHITGMGMLAGIGFTMSIFIAMLSFNDAAHIIESKFAILCASVISGVIGYLFLKSVSKKHAKTAIGN
ncbi:Na+/H+ antiporter NhaA [Nubsella zeaxanthinifaciens]|jgi:NhaA family Na+:H+ antiporter|uniref:Na+/H+ antiporter NhaA n=1 Tax=Nubsella zeaxanthinifaciens TaxID=392412 RepID=UPI000DE46BE2|nr:Na+/H+ antiporter NhaA [Nubsella zeaxanthinifaciens]